jgi:hypothetical protein
MATARLAFVLPVPWDRAAIALERAIEHGRTPLDLLDRGNGYWHLRAGATTVHIELRIRSSAATTITIVARRPRLALPGGGSRAEALLRTVREDVERSLRAA